MSAAAIAVLVLVGVAAVVALRWPLLGLLAYLWMDFMRPNDSLVELRAVRPMLALAGATLAGTLWRFASPSACRRSHIVLRPTSPPHRVWRIGDVWSARRSPMAPLAALAAIVALNVAVSADRTQSALTLLHIAKMVVLVWLLDRLVRDAHALRAVLWVVVISLGVLAVGAVAEATARGIWYEFRPGFVIEGPPGLGDGPFRDNNNLARVLALSLPLWWALAMLGGWTRWLAVAGLSVTGAGIVATFSRSGFVALLVGTAAVASVYRPAWRAAVLWVGGIAVLLALVPAPYRARVATLGAATTDASVRGRLEVWGDALRGTTRNPVLGQGAGTFRSREDAPPRRSSHNVFLEVLAELGIAGLSVYGWLLGATLLRLHRLRRRAACGDWLGYAAAAVQAALLAYLAAGLALSAPFAAPLFVLIGLSLALKRCAHADPRRDGPHRTDA